MLVTSATDVACPSYYTFTPSFDHSGGSLMFRISQKTVYSLRYSSFFKFASRIGTERFVTRLAFGWRAEIDWAKTAVRARFVSYDFSTGDVHGLSEVAVQAKKRLRDVDGFRWQ